MIVADVLETVRRAAGDEDACIGGTTFSSAVNAPPVVSARALMIAGLRRSRRGDHGPGSTGTKVLNVSYAV